MPMFDLVCENGHEQIDLLLKLGERPPCPTCGSSTSTLWKGTPPSVIGDECDVWIKHGICNPDGTPRHYRSKSEMTRVAKEMGLTNTVRHVGERGSDKNKNTVKWT